MRGTLLIDIIATTQASCSLAHTTLVLHSQRHDIIAPVSSVSTASERILQHNDTTQSRSRNSLLRRPRRRNSPLPRRIQHPRRDQLPFSSSESRRTTLKPTYSPFFTVTSTPQSPSRRLPKSRYHPPGRRNRQGHGQTRYRREQRGMDSDGRFYESGGEFGRGGLGSVLACECQGAFVALCCGEKVSGGE